MKRNKPFGSRRGSAFVEFALCAPLAVLTLVGTFQFGYLFYVYNQLQLGVRSGVRYASLMDYKGKTSSCISSTTTYPKNVVVYGTATPQSSAQPIIRGLTTDNVDVSFNLDSNGVPTVATMSIKNFTVDALVTKITINGKPWASVPYAGRYAPNECY